MFCVITGKNANSKFALTAMKRVSAVYNVDIVSIFLEKAQKSTNFPFFL